MTTTEIATVLTALTTTAMTANANGHICGVPIMGNVNSAEMIALGRAKAEIDKRIEEIKEILTAVTDEQVAEMVTENLKSKFPNDLRFESGTIDESGFEELVQMGLIRDSHKR